MKSAAIGGFPIRPGQTGRGASASCSSLYTSWLARLNLRWPTCQRWQTDGAPDDVYDRNRPHPGTAAGCTHDLTPGRVLRREGANCPEWASAGGLATRYR